MKRSISSFNIAILLLLMITLPKNGHSQAKITIIDSPLFIGTINHVKLNNIDTNEVTLSTEDGYISGTPNKNEYAIGVYVADSATIIGINKKTKDTTDIYHFTVERLPENELNAEITCGNIKGSESTPENFKKQDKIIVKENFQFISASVYFAGTGFPNICVMPLLGPDLTMLKKKTKLCEIGSTISFTNIKVKNPAGRIIFPPSFRIILVDKMPTSVETPEETLIYYGGLSRATASYKLFARQKEIKLKQGYTFESAMIHFAGAGFPTPVNQKITTTNLSYLKNQISNCQPGTVVCIDEIKVNDSKSVLHNSAELCFSLY